MEDNLKSVFHEIQGKVGAGKRFFDIMVSSGKRFFDIMVNFCAVLNCEKRASREKEKSYFRFPGIISNNGEEGF